MKVTQMPPVHAANLVANSGNTAHGVDIIVTEIYKDEHTGLNFPLYHCAWVNTFWKKKCFC